MVTVVTAVSETSPMVVSLTFCVSSNQHIIESLSWLVVITALLIGGGVYKSKRLICCM